MGAVATGPPGAAAAGTSDAVKTVAKASLYLVVAGVAMILV